ncbi:hypothetical protein CSKR_108976 [Clonorchis sinensis]|uniref:Uncharacterized protein n=1 Tax=Clonorchis sinensis TaxID=79923 RepID=A0A419PQD8_CLOSI|nr:hypothetical protein CSKR_108976 [Clonorchis sinensis]
MYRDTLNRRNTLFTRTPHINKKATKHCCAPSHSKVVSASPGLLKWLERESTDRNVRGSNPTSASRLPLSTLWQPGSISALVLPSRDMAARHRKATRKYGKASNPIADFCKTVLSHSVSGGFELTDHLYLFFTF